MRPLTLKLIAIALSLALPALLADCSSETTPSGEKNTDDDERGSVGVPPAAAGYCIKLGYQYDGACHFPDGTSCDAWKFFYGECGQAYSYCNKHGGSVANELRDAGSFTETLAVCTLNGKTCDEQNFFKTGKCE